MTSIIAEINTIGDLLSDVGATRFYKQDIPKKHVVNTIGIRWLGDRNVDMTNVTFSVVRTYQVTYFGKSEIDCITNIESVRAALTIPIKTKVRNEDAYMTLGPIGFSQPTKSETDGVYFIVGIMSVQVFAKRPQEEQQLIRFVGAGLNGDRLDITEDTVTETNNDNVIGEFAENGPKKQSSGYSFMIDSESVKFTKNGGTK